MEWLQIEPEDDPNSFIGIHPENGVLIGPHIRIGQKYKVIYSSPVRLPFMDPEEGPVAFHTAEITGTLTSPLTMKNVECIICKPDDYTVRMNMKSNKSQFRFFVDDKLESVEVK